MLSVLPSQLAFENKQEIGIDPAWGISFGQIALVATNSIFRQLIAGLYFLVFK